MAHRKELHARLLDRFGPVIDLRGSMEVIDRLVEEIAASLQGPRGGAGGSASAPFGISWMDSWAAHWVYGENLRGAASRGQEVTSVLRGLADVKFNERIAEIREFLRGLPDVEAPDAGPPEPGTPPAGPAAFQPAPPDGGTPEPG